MWRANKFKIHRLRTARRYVERELRRTSEVPITGLVANLFGIELAGYAVVNKMSDGERTGRKVENAEHKAGRATKVCIIDNVKPEAKSRGKEEMKRVAYRKGKCKNGGKVGKKLEIINSFQPIRQRLNNTIHKKTTLSTIFPIIP